MVLALPLPTVRMLAVAVITPVLAPLKEAAVKLRFALFSVPFTVSEPVPMLVLETRFTVCPAEITTFCPVVGTPAGDQIAALFQFPEAMVDFWANDNPFAPNRESDKKSAMRHPFNEVKI